jgi:hypothetical protein
LKKKDVYSERTCILKDFGAGLASRRHIQGVQSSSSCKVRKSLTGIDEAIYKMIKISNFIKKCVPDNFFIGLQRMEKIQKKLYIPLQI